MKASSNCFIIIVLLSGINLCEAQQVATSQTSVPAPTQYSIVSSEANASIWQSTIYQAGPNGQIIPTTHQYTELASGLNHLVNGQWLRSSEQIDILPDGTAQATNGQHQVYFPPNIYGGQIFLVTPPGQLIRSQPLGLSYDDGTNTVMIAELTNSVGELVSSNVLVYPNAFVGVNADLRYTYTKAGFEQDVIMHNQPPSPESFNMDSQNARLQMLTEFFNPPQPSVTQEASESQTGLTLNDEYLDFGGMAMGRGKAFLLGSKTESSTLVSKQWVNISGRQILVEEVPLMALANDLQQLPATAITAKAASPLHVVSAKRLLPEHPVASTRPKGAIIARATLLNKGLVLDYLIMSSQTNYTFRGDRTYYLSGTVNLSGTNTFEGGAVLKYGRNATLNFTGTGWQVNSLTSAYRPFICTSTNDNSVGEIISGSTGNPTQCASTALEFNNYSGAGTTTLSNFCIRWAQTAIQSSASLNLYNGQIVNCEFGYYDNSSVTGGVNLRNMLFAQVSADFESSGNLSVNAQNVTFSGVNDFTYVGNGDNYYLENCILANVSTLAVGGYGDSYTFNGMYNGFYNSSEFGMDTTTNAFYPFQTVGAGDYYLTNNCNFFNQGIIGIIDPVLQAELGTKTTHPPILLSNVIVTANTILNPQAGRENINTPDLGYLYDPIDYIVDQYTITNATLTLTNGAALATYNAPGIQVENGGSIVSIGTPTTPNWLVRYQNVQEQSVALGTTNVSSGITISDTNGAGSGTFQFTKFSMPENGGYHFYDDGSSVFNNLVVQNSELYGGTNDFSGGTSSRVALLNDLFRRSSIYASNASASATLALSNSLAWGDVRDPQSAFRWNLVCVQQRL